MIVDGERSSTSPRPASAGPPSAPALEQQLLAGLRRGDDGSYETLVRTHAPRMLAVARRLLRNEEDACDVLQESFLQAFRSVGRFREESGLATWLHRIVVNQALMRLRRSRRHPEVPIEELLPTFEEDGHQSQPMMAWPTSAESELLNAERRAQVRACIDRLPSSYRTVFILREIEELSTKEAASALGITPTAVKIRLHRSRQALATLLTPLVAH